MNIKRAATTMGIMLAGALLYGNSAMAAPAFVDGDQIPDWSKADVELTSQFKVFIGDAVGTFRPEDRISRAEFTAILMRAFSLPSNLAVALPFSDVRGGWYEDVVTKAVQSGVIQTGDFGTEFRPDQPITRAEMARLVSRAVDARKTVFTPTNAIAFTDVTANSPFAPSIQKATSYGIINGVGENRFEPNDTATRAEAATMVGRAMRLGKPLEVDHPGSGAWGLEKNTRLSDGAFLAGWELAASRPVGTKVDLTPIQRFFTPEARAKFEQVLEREVPAHGKVGYFALHGAKIKYIGQDHAIAPGYFVGVNHNQFIDFPLVRQFDGRWIVTDIPFDDIDMSKLTDAGASYVSYVYTDRTGSYVGSNDFTDFNAFLNSLEKQDWWYGTVRILRIGSRPWIYNEQYKQQVEEFHKRMDAKAAANKNPYGIVTFDFEVHVQSFASEVDLVAEVARAAYFVPLPHQVNDVPWGRIAESAWLRNLYQQKEYRAPYDKAIRANQEQYVPEFFELLRQARDPNNIIR